MKLIIVTGLSGAGKTIALHSLEDRGGYCIDNLPVNLLPEVAAQMAQLGDDYTCMAVGVDVRNIALQNMPELLNTLARRNIDYEILFLDASDAVLLKRFSETRRKHPLTTQNRSLAEAIQEERGLLSILCTQADIHIDTSNSNVHQLRDMVRLRAGLQSGEPMPLLFQSFGFKYGVPQDADFVFDMRCLPNPYWEPHLRPLTGQDQAIVDFLQPQEAVQQMTEQLIAFLTNWIPQFEASNRSYLNIAIGCTGGHHRSVFMSECLARHFRGIHPNVLVRHRDLNG
ncbi:RNase adapter RapZ [Candidatus Venteria ishoeyi]|uniref:GlmZ(SRNA)-inactivating NTPase n=1 Tax=Candidatus Venteria ishoeyi TaxID=1899563 RepID=A0A1H6FEG1_9GAMM|nr:RNase adapter RapZ [Candidatus Venteria ishoeyi]MDM8548269.1 RNase adapter RapZ [Candidatus Venteria ishoeyi]SEH08470.1 glmZ(sRNA)-inactivating NTPase [Candidatus Venteria ishoeyi]